MFLKIKKSGSKPHVISYIRNDGSETWTHADDFFVLHDLSHFALEKKMQYKTAFMGMLNSGMDIKDFEDREKRKKIIVTREGWYAENMANLFLIELSQGVFEDFNTVSRESFEKLNLGLPAPRLTDEEISS